MTLYISTTHPDYRTVHTIGAHRRPTRWHNVKEWINHTHLHKGIR